MKYINRCCKYSFIFELTNKLTYICVHASEFYTRRYERVRKRERECSYVYLNEWLGELMLDFLVYTHSILLPAYERERVCMRTYFTTFLATITWNIRFHIHFNQFFYEFNAKFFHYSNHFLCITYKFRSIH